MSNIKVEETNFSSFDEEDWKRQEAQDEYLLQQTLSVNPEAIREDTDTQQDALFDPNRPLDLGEKADDAMDFEDISDDDLPEEEEASGDKEDDVPGLTDDTGMYDDDDLFGDGLGRASSPPVAPEDTQDTLMDGIANEPHIEGGLTPPPTEPEVDLFSLNFPGARQDSVSQRYDESLVKTLWPKFEKNTKLYLSTELLPQKQVEYIPKVPLKVPRPVNPTKVSLDIAPDTEKSFRTAGPSTGDKRKRIQEAEAKGFIAIVEGSEDEADDEDVFDYSYPTDTVGGKTLMDLEVICADWDSIINRVPDDVLGDEEEEEVPRDEWFVQTYGNSKPKPKPKPKKPIETEEDFINAPQFACPSFDNFEEMAAQTAKRVVLDLNDPTLLVDIQEFNPAAKRRRIGAGGDFKRVGNGSFVSSLVQRFNISNDEAYDALKENHQSRVRATLGNFPVEHSMPAIKLQWPYYRVKLFIRDARSFHRPALQFTKSIEHPVKFARPGFRKKKTLKGLPTHEIFRNTTDLSLSDFYSSATLLEYSEEHPTVLSNFGMGNRIINYYRRKNAEDTDRPQPEDRVGDTQILLPEDRSPFANFGMVNPGETIRAIHNEMYRAPIFKHEPKKTDFLIIRNSTGEGGTNWYIRNIDNLFVVGQQFPSVEIPGPHSRRVTNAAKARLRMIAYRMLKKDAQNSIKINDITRHIPETTETQNRQKLKEFLIYDKGEKVWRMRPQEALPDKNTIRKMVTPEDVCTIDAMQVGCRYLEDAGYEIVSVKEGKDADNDDDGSEELEQKLAPWKSTKAFIDASSEKAMLQLHGAGDPTGRGLGFSFIKTSMKGGYLEARQGGNNVVKQSIETDKKGKSTHTYNVKEQQVLYNAAIKNIWDKQKENLSDAVEHEEDPVMDDDNGDNRRGIAQTPQYSATPAGMDDTASTVSRQNRVMHIKRTFKDRDGNITETTEVITDPRVWRMYEKRRREIDAAATDIEQVRFTGNEEVDRAELARVQGELTRLNRNKDRRIAREKQKGNQGKGRGRKSTVEPDNPGSPSSMLTPSIEGGGKPTGTTRKCANCGQTGHIKTNKKLCPMLNGTMKQEDMATNHGGFGAINPPSFS